MKPFNTKFLSIVAIQLVGVVMASNLAASLGSLILRVATRSSDGDRSAKAEAVASEVNAYEQAASDYPSFQAFKRDLAKLPGYPFRSFSGWRSAAFSSPSININREGVRATPVLLPVNSGLAVWMLGGSTVWGYGVSDRETMPAYFQGYSGFRTLNLGEQAYASRQSLNLLLNELVRARLNGSLPRLVIAYEGVNDTLYPCTTPSDQPFVHDREREIQQALVAAKHAIGLRRALQATVLAVAGSTYRSLFPAVYGFQQQLLGTKTDRGGKGNVDASAKRCSSDGYARSVAFNLVQNWELAHHLLAAQGIRFYAFLQPTPSNDPAYKGRVVSDFTYYYSRIFPLVRAYAKDKPWFVDGSSWFVRYGQPAWLDPCCHANPMANRHIARNIIRELQARGALPR